MLNGRLYRAAFLPFLLALAVAAFSLGARPLPLGSTLAPDAFEGSRAFAELQSLAARFPIGGRGAPGTMPSPVMCAHLPRPRRDRGRGVLGAHASLPGADDRRAALAGERDRPAPRLDQRHADPDHRPSRCGRAWLGGRAVGDGRPAGARRVFASRETKRTIVLASTSGGSGGDGGRPAGGAPRWAQRPEGGRRAFDAAIVLGDLAGEATRAPLVVPFSDGQGSAPLSSSAPSTMRSVTRPACRRGLRACSDSSPTWPSR